MNPEIDQERWHFWCGTVYDATRFFVDIYEFAAQAVQRITEFFSELGEKLRSMIQGVYSGLRSVIRLFPVAEESRQRFRGVCRFQRVPVRCKPDVRGYRFKPCIRARNHC